MASHLSRIGGCLLTLALTFMFLIPANGQGFDSIERGRMKDMLKTIKEDVKKNYYDPGFHGVDLEDRFKKADDRLGQVKSTGEALGVIAQTLIDFNDSHLFFMPPMTNLSVEYGWRMESIGEKTFVTAVKPNSDADRKGLKVGDEVVAISGFHLKRSELWKVLYYYNAISKRNGLAIDVVSPGDASPRHLEIASELRKSPQKIQFSTYFRLGDDFYNEENSKHRFFKVGNINVWQMPSFELMPEEVESLVKRFDRHAPLIIDLRRNGGGLIASLETLAGYFFDKDIKIADLKARKKMDPMVAKTHGKDVFDGKLIVLLDSQSASAAELFARLIQLEKRGVVLGDRSSGAVMQAMQFQETMGVDSIVIYGVSVTNADVIMSDGKSLEHEGVLPDEVILPSPADLNAGRDPVLSRAVELLGGRIDPVEAGRMRKYYW